MNSPVVYLVLTILRVLLALLTARSILPQHRSLTKGNYLSFIFTDRSRTERIKNTLRLLRIIHSRFSRTKGLSRLYTYQIRTPYSSREQGISRVDAERRSTAVTRAIRVKSSPSARRRRPSCRPPCKRALASACAAASGDPLAGF